MATLGTYKRGYHPPSTHRLLMTVPYRYTRKIADADVPPSFATIPDALSYWLNDRDGDCVSAEEMFNIDCAWGDVVDDAAVAAFIRKYHYANGADLSTVMETVAKYGIIDGANKYTEGPEASVDWTNYSEVCAAIAESRGSLKIAVAANQLEYAIDDSKPFDFFVGFRSDSATDHCTGVAGYGTAQALLDLFNAKYKSSMSLPSNLTPSTPCVSHFTWKRLQIMDFASLGAVCREMYVRNPTSIKNGMNPTPPTPVIPPPPQPNPLLRPPTTDSLIYNLTIFNPDGSRQSVESFTVADFAGIRGLANAAALAHSCQTAMQQHGTKIEVVSNA